MVSKIQLIKNMEAAAFTGDWEKFKTFLTEDIYYFVGNTTEISNDRQAIVDYLIKFLKTEIGIYHLDFLIAYENEDTVVTELAVKGKRVPDQKDVEFPTVDVYRFRGNQICDWRVYAIEPTHVGKSVLTRVE